LYLCKDSSCADCGPGEVSNCWESSISSVATDPSLSHTCSLQDEVEIDLKTGWNLFSPSITAGVDISVMRNGGCSISVDYKWD
jgi:hypothetical protein